MTQRLEAPDFDDRLVPPGEVIADRFEAGEKIGEGPFGHVYRAKDTLVEADVAIKVYFDDVVKTPLDEEQFLKATKRARSLTQENVVRLHDSGVHDDHPWVSMQHLEGLNLRKVARLRWQRQESFGIQEMEPIVSQLTLALQHVGRDYPHGNLKPENVIFLPDLLKVTDSYVLSALPRDVFAEGTEDDSFVAPELQDEHIEPDARCDVFSVGALIGYMLFGPDYTPGSQRDAPGGLSAVDVLCERAMAADPDDRYHSVEALNEDFTSIVDTGALLEQRPTPADRPPEPEQSKSPASAPPPASVDVDADVDVDVDETDAAVEDAEPETGDREPAVDPLEMETPSDIGMPLEEDLETTEYDRDEVRELGDYLPTNEVDRDQLEDMQAQYEAAQQASEQTDTEDEPVDQDVVDEPESQPEQSTEPEPGDLPPSPKGEQPNQQTGAESDRDDEQPDEKADKSDADDESSNPPVGAIVAAVVLGAVFVAVIMLAVSDDPEDEPQPQPEAQPAEVTQKQEDEPEVDEEELARQERLEQIEQAVAAATEFPVDALDDALEQAGERHEELEEQRRQEEEQQQQAAAATGAAQAPSGAAPAGCPSEMVRVAVGGSHVCVDAYQYPGRGHLPQVNVSWFDANRLCEQQDKRLCELQEWQTACGRVYPYGASFDPDRCNTADADGFDRSLAETGSSPGCRSPSGAYDMSGNAHEWVQEQRVAGGAFDSGADTATCQYSSAMSPGTSRGNVGFRCCKSP